MRMKKKINPYFRFVKICCAMFFLLFLNMNVKAQLPKNEAQFKEYFQKRVDSLDQIEGIWNVTTTLNIYRADTLSETKNTDKPVRVAVLKNNGKIETYDISGAPFNAEFFTTEVAGVYFYKVFFPETQQASRKKALISKSGEMEYSLELSDEYVRQKYKDGFGEDSHVENNFKWSRIYPLVWKK
jgi:hypothetical protein